MSSSKNNIDLLNIDVFKDIKPEGFVNNEALKAGLQNFAEILQIVKKLVILRDEVTLPTEFTGQINAWENLMKDWVRRFEEAGVGHSSEIVQQKDSLLKQIQSIRNKTFDLNDNNNNKMIAFLTAASLYKENQDSFDYAKKRLDDILKEFSTDIIQTKKNAEDSDKILEELRKKTQEEVVSDYALIFSTEENNHANFSKKWLWASIVQAITLILAVYLIQSYGWLDFEILNESGYVVRYSYTNLTSKLILYLLLLFALKFSVKQYNINSHLKTLSAHRKNALNSYKLFSHSISTDDDTTRNALMLQVAKSIYDYTQSTGYLNDKGSSSSEIIELTKIVGNKGMS